MLGVKQTPLRTRRCWRSGFTLRLITIIGDIIESAAVFGQSTTQWSREWSKQHKYNRQKKTQTNSFHVMLRSFYICFRCRFTKLPSEKSSSGVFGQHHRERALNVETNEKTVSTWTPKHLRSIS